MAVPDLHELMVDVLLVGREDARVLAQPPKDGERHVHERHREDQHREQGRDEERGDVVPGRNLLDGATDPGDRGRGEHHPKHHAPGVAHDDPRRMEVVGQEAERGPGRDG